MEILLSTFRVCGSQVVREITFTYLTNALEFTQPLNIHLLPFTNVWKKVPDTELPKTLSRVANNKVLGGTWLLEILKLNLRSTVSMSHDARHIQHAVEFTILLQYSVVVVVYHVFVLLSDLLLLKFWSVVYFLAILNPGMYNVSKNKQTYLSVSKFMNNWHTHGIAHEIYLSHFPVISSWLRQHWNYIHILRLVSYQIPEYWMTLETVMNKILIQGLNISSKNNKYINKWVILLSDNDTNCIYLTHNIPER